MSYPLLAVNNLTHLYAPGKGFSDVSFELWPGEVLGIVGESGSGKTTLLQAISARLTPQQGEVRYQNRSLYAIRFAHRVHRVHIKICLCAWLSLVRFVVMSKVVNYMD